LLSKAAFAAGITAPLFFLLAGIFGNASGAPPSPYEAPAGEFVAYYLENGQSTLISAVLNLFGGILVAIFAAGLWQRFCDFDSPAVRGWATLGLIGSAVFCAVALVAGAIQISLAGLAGVDEPAAEAVHGAAFLWNAAVLATGLAAVPLLGGFSMAGLAAPAYGRWLAWTGLVGAGAGVLSALPDAVAAVSRVAANLLSVVGQLELPILFLWLIGASFGIKRTYPPAGRG
jgi:hypothetical protein